MDITSILETILSVAKTIILTISGVLISIADLVPFGRVILVAVLAGLVWFVVMPRWVRDRARPYLPKPWSLSKPARYVIVHALAEKEWLRQKDAKKPEVRVEIKKEIEYVPRRRTFGEWVHGILLAWGFFVALQLTVVALYLSWR